MDVTEQLKSLGFTTNEAKAYTALLCCQPASAYEIAKQAGLPTSKIYETVARLTSRGVLLVADGEGKNSQYCAMMPVDLMTSIASTTLANTQRLLPVLENMGPSENGNLIWPLNDHDQLRTRTLALISQAEQSLLISLWAEELTWCQDALNSAEARGIQIALVHFGAPTIHIGATYHHPAEQTLYSEKGGRGLTAVADSNQVVIATVKHNNIVEGAWSRNDSFVTVAEDYIKHDVYITKVTRFLGDEVVARFGEDYSRLRNVFDADA